jgi:hypothetical protein
MAIAYGSAGVGAGTENLNAQLAIPCPATVNANDILIAHVIWLDNVSEPVDPAGWTRLYPTSGLGAPLGTGTPVGRAYVYGKIANGTEGGTTINFGTTATTVGRFGRIFTFTGYVSGSITDVVPLASFSNIASLQNPPMPTVTTTTAGSLAIALVSQDDNNSIAAATGATGGTWAEPSLFVEFSNASIGAQGAMCQLQICTPTSNPGTVTGGSSATNADKGSTIGFEIRPNPPFKSTPVARISLASYGEPTTRTLHSINIRARTTSGSTGVIKAALYEGANNRSGDLTSASLTNTLADYKLNIPDASAANITDYSNLEIRIWGYDSAGNALVFEVADLYLEVPVQGVPTYYGSITSPFTFSRVISGNKQTFGQVVRPFTFSRVISGTKKTFGQVVRPFTFSRVISGTRQTFGQVVRPLIFSRVISGTKQTFGQIVRPFTFVKNVAGILSNPNWDLTGSWEIDYLISGTSAAHYEWEITQVDGIITAAHGGNPVGGPWAYEIVLDSGYVIGDTFSLYCHYTVGSTGPHVLQGVIAPDGTISGTWSQNGANGTFVTLSGSAIPLTLPQYGVVSFPIAFVENVNGKLGAFGSVVRAFTFTKEIAGQRRTFGQIAAPFTFVKAVSGKLGTFGVIARPFTLTRSVLATKQTFAQVIRPFTFVKDVSGRRTAFGQLVRPFSFVKNVVGQRRTFGQVSAPFVFTKTVGGIGIFINRISATFTFTKNVSGTRRTFSQIVVPFTFTKAVSGTKQTFGQIVRSFTFVKNVTGKLGAFSQIVSPFIFTKSVAGRKQTFAQVVRPFTFVKDVVGRKTTFGQTATTIVTTITTVGNRAVITLYGIVSAPFEFTKSVIGKRTTFGQTVTALTFTKVVDGSRKTFGQIAAPFVFVKNIVAKKTTFGQVARPFTFIKSVSGIRTTRSQVAAFFTFNKAVSGRKTTFSRVDLPLIFTDQTSGRKQTFGKVGLPINIAFDVVAGVQGIRFGRTSMSLVFEKNVAGQKKTFGQITAPHFFVRSVQGLRKTFSSSAFPINASIVVAGTTSANIYGRVALSLVLGEQTSGQRRTFGQIARPYSFDAELNGLLEAFGSVDFPVDFVVDVNTGRVETYSSLAFEFLLGLETAGIIRPHDIILNLAKAIYLGSTPVDAVYTASQEVWSK